MDLSKTNRLKKILVLLYLVFFSFGQLAGIRPVLLGRAIPLFFCDVTASLFGALVLLEKGRFPKIWSSIKNFILFIGFSLLFSLLIFDPIDIIFGALYAVRVVAYSYFFLGIYRLSRNNPKIKSFLFSALLYLCLFIAIFGLFQYYNYPDVRPFVVWGWDDHLYRLVGTFLDPGFTSIFLVFGFLLGLAAAQIFREKKYLIILGVFLFALALTYSRAGYTALLAGVGTFFLAKRSLKKCLFVLILFVTIIFVIPSFGSEGVKLGRTKSIFARMGSYSEGIALLKQSPVFGIGFNNLCVAKEKFLNQPRNFGSHACSGIDASLLMLLSTTGVAGTLSFIYLLYRVLRAISNDLFGLIFKSSLMAIIIHSLFINSLFYPWVMGYFSVLLAISIREKN